MNQESWIEMSTLGASLTRGGKVLTTRLLIASVVVLTHSPHCPVRADSFLHWSSVSPLLD